MSEDQPGSAAGAPGHTPLIGRPLAKRWPWVAAIAGLLVVPGTLLSIALGAIGAIMALLLLVDFVTARSRGREQRTSSPSLVIQLLVGSAIAGAIGGGIALGAWIKK